MPDHAEKPNCFTIRYSQIVFGLITIAAPVLHLISLGILWFIPMISKKQRYFLVFVEILYSWSCIDVFAVSICSAVMQISQFARFMVGDQCNWINPLISLFFAGEDTIKGHETCFDVELSLIHI